MIVYLDQNKWIELSRIFHGRDKHARSKSVLKEITASIDIGYIYPLSSFHYLEFSRISNVRRRSRLGRTMWEISKGLTLASINYIVRREIEIALSKHYQIVPRPLTLIGRGITHAFGQKAENILPDWANGILEEKMLTGSELLNIEPLSFRSETHRANFKEHLENIHRTKHELKKNQWDDWLHTICLIDIIEPMCEVISEHGLPREALEIGKDNLSELVKDMPTRRIDLHLHRQVLKNPNYRPKKSDLEDWGALGMAASYCDVVVCEKHMASMLKREGFKTKAKVVTRLDQIFESLNIQGKMSRRISQ